jgi:hypothetical protein
MYTRKIKNKINSFIKSVNKTVRNFLYNNIEKITTIAVSSVSLIMFGMLSVAAMVVSDEKPIDDTKTLVTESISTTDTSESLVSIVTVTTEETTTMTTTTLITTTTTVGTTTKKTTTSEAEKVFLAYNSDSKRVHKSDCEYYSDWMTPIEGNVINEEARKCTSCNPDIEITNLYEPEEEIVIENNVQESYDYSYSGNVLTASAGRIQGPSGEETYYNLDMSGVIYYMRQLGYDEVNYPYWVRDDGCKMLGPYIMVAANLNIRPKGTILECSLGTAMVCDTGGFASWNTYGLDIATTW